MNKKGLIKVFISYSRTDEDRAIAGLLVNALEKEGIITLYDEALYSGSSIADSVAEYMREADVILLILTNNSENSKWVNQELGFASALYKKIIPIRITSSTEPLGLIYGYRPFECLNWFSHEYSIKRLLTNISKAVEEKNPAPIVIQNEMERTREIINRLNQIIKQLGQGNNQDNQDSCRLNSSSGSNGSTKQNQENTNGSNTDKIQLYERSTLSIFSIDSTLGYNSHYLELLCQQRSVMEDLISNKMVETRLHICPHARQYTTGVKKQRFEKLLEWLEKTPENSNLKIRIDMEHRGPNTLAVRNNFALEGLQTRSDSEYEYTLSWRYPSEKIEYCFYDFNKEDWICPQEAARKLKDSKDEILND